MVGVGAVVGVGGVVVVEKKRRGRRRLRRIGVSCSKGKKSIQKAGFGHGLSLHRVLDRPVRTSTYIHMTTHFG